MPERRVDAHDLETALETRRELGREYEPGGIFVAVIAWIAKAIVNVVYALRR